MGSVLNEFMTVFVSRYVLFFNVFLIYLFFSNVSFFVSRYFWEFVYPTLSTMPERFLIVSRPKNAKNGIFSKHVVQTIKK